MHDTRRLRRGRGHASAALALAALLGVACNALVGNQEATPAPVDECGDALACNETGAPDASGDGGADGGADVIIPYDGPLPVVHVEIFGERPAAYGPLEDAAAAYPLVHDWMPYQYRAADLGPSASTLLVGLDGFNRISATSTNCIGEDCPTPTVTVAGGAFRADLIDRDAGGFGYRIVSTSPPSLLHVPSGTDVCLVFHHPGWTTTRNVLVRVYLGDFDGDGMIVDGGADYDAFTQDFGAAPPTLETHTDLNSDGVCNGGDNLVMRSTIGNMRTLSNPCP